MRILSPRPRSPGPIVLLSLCLALWGVAQAAPSTQPTIEQKTQAMLEKWQPKFEKEKLNWIVSTPFLLAGDGPVIRLERYRDGTVLSAQKALSAMYFKTPPDAPIMILLFEKAEPYERLSKEWFKEDSPSHFGYCTADGCMVMNVSTGTGTLVHELVHALIRSDFPDVPRWFNEGLGSLYEQSNINRDKITGLVNWRLPALQKAMKNKTLRPLAEMIEDDDFYSDELRGINYAQSRYLMMYLQEKGLLGDFYRQFKAAAEKDPKGLATLKAVVKQDWGTFEKEWKAWVLTLGQ